MNYIHDIPYKVEKSAIEGLDVSTRIYNAVIEISNGDNIKYEIHPSGDYLTAVRALNSIFRYPFSYGYIPQTIEEDGDGLDVIIVTAEPLAHLTVAEIRVLGYVPTIDNGKKDVKVIAVPAYSTLKKVSTDKVMSFLKNYKYPNFSLTQVGEFVANIAETDNIIEEAHKTWYNKFHKAPVDVKPVEEEEVDEAVAAPTKVEEPVVQESVKEEPVFLQSTLKPIEEKKEEPASEPVVSPISQEKVELQTNSSEEVKQEQPIEEPVKQVEDKEVLKAAEAEAPKEESTETSVPFLEENGEQTSEEKIEEPTWLC